MNKALIESFLRHVLGAGLASLTAVMATAGAISPLELAGGDWLVVMGAMWAALVPPVIRFLNTKDPAFGRIATAVAAEVTAKLEAEAAKASAPAKKPGTRRPAASGKTSSKT